MLQLLYVLFFSSMCMGMEQSLSNLNESIGVYEELLPAEINVIIKEQVEDCFKSPSLIKELIEVKKSSLVTENVVPGFHESYCPQHAYQIDDCQMWVNDNRSGYFWVDKVKQNNENIWKMANTKELRVSGKIVEIKPAVKSPLFTWCHSYILTEKFFLYAMGDNTFEMYPHVLSFDIDPEDNNEITYLQYHKKNKTLHLKCVNVAYHELITHDATQLTAYYNEKSESYYGVLPIYLVRASSCLFAVQMESKSKEGILFLIEKNVHKKIALNEIITLDDQFYIESTAVWKYHHKSNQWIFISRVLNTQTGHTHPVITLFNAETKKSISLVIDQITLYKSSAFCLQLTPDENFLIGSFENSMFAGQFTKENTLKIKNVFYNSYWFGKILSLVIPNYDSPLSILAIKNPVFSSNEKLYVISNWQEVFNYASQCEQYSEYCWNGNRSYEQMGFIMALEQLLELDLTNQIKRTDKTRVGDYKKLIHDWLHTRAKQLQLPKYFARLCLQLSK